MFNFIKYILDYFKPFIYKRMMASFAKKELKAINQEIILTGKIPHDIEKIMDEYTKILSRNDGEVKKLSNLYLGSKTKADQYKFVAKRKPAARKKPVAKRKPAAKKK